MSLRELARIALPPHRKDGGFDHAAVHAATSRLYVAHTANDAVDVVDLATRRFLRSLPGFPGVAGIWVDDSANLLFASNRGEDTASVVRLPSETEEVRFETGRRPNGLAFDPAERTLLVAGVGDPAAGSPPSLSMFDLRRGTAVGRIEMPGRTRWATFHAPSESFYVNVADPPQIVRVGRRSPTKLAGSFPVAGVGPHGLEQSTDGRSLYCACDGRQLLSVEIPSGAVRLRGELAGPPDVLWLNPRRGHLYVAIGDPGVLQVFRTEPWAAVETVETGPGAHTCTVDSARNEVYSLLPETHEVLVLGDG